MGGGPIAISAVLPEALGKSEDRALILGVGLLLICFQELSSICLPSVLLTVSDMWHPMLALVACVACLGPRMDPLTRFKDSGG